MDFAAFLLLNAILYIRPQEVVPALSGLPLYNISFCLCLVLSLPSLLAGGTLRSIFGHPISACVLTVTITALLSSIIVGDMQGLADGADIFLKIILYYLLFITVVSSPARMKWFLASIVIDAVIISIIGILDYEGIYSIPSLQVVHLLEGDDETLSRRLASTGLFGDPNDLCLFLAGAVINCVYLLSDRSAGKLIRAFWLLPLSVLLMAIHLTKSRGGMLALLVGLAIYVVTRFGRRGLLVLVLAAPFVLGASGRQFNFNVSEGTAQGRVDLWEFYIKLFIHNPILGVGFNRSMEYMHHVAHNSYIQVYAEIGFFGGSAFLASMFLSLWAVWRTGPPRTKGLDPELARLWPFMLGGISAYMIGISTLARCYIAPTYAFLALAMAYEKMALAGSPRQPLRLGFGIVLRMIGTSIAYLIIMYIYISKSLN